MRLRKTLIAVGTAAALVVIPTSAYAGGSSNDCRDGKKWNDYKYAPPAECPKPPKDRDHRDRDRDRDYGSHDRKEKETETTGSTTTSSTSVYSGRVLKTF